MNAAPPPATPALAPEAEALVGALEQAIAGAPGGLAENRAIAQLLTAIRAQAATMAPAAGPRPPPDALAKDAAGMATALDTLEDLLEALQLFPAGGS